MRFLLILFFLLTLALPVSAQSQWQHGCEAEPLSLVSPVAGSVDYAGACQVFLQCGEGRDNALPCLVPAFDTLNQVCPAGDESCRYNVLLFANTIHLLSVPYSEMWPEPVPQSVIDAAPAALTAFQAGNDHEALRLLQQIPADYVHPAPQFSRAIILLALDRPEEALAELNQSLGVMPANPLVRLVRAEVYAELGETTRAALDAAWLAEATSNDTQLAPLVADVVAAYPLDESGFTEWNVYPVISQSSGPGGAFFTDLLSEAAHPIRIGLFDDPDLMVIRDPQSALDTGLQLVVLEPTGSGYAYWLSQADSNGGGLQLTPFEDLYLATSDASYFEGYGRTDYLIAPAGAPDPRDNFVGERCVVRSRLRQGMQIGSREMFAPIPIFDAAGNGTQQGAAESLTVLIAHDCIDGVWWWQVQAEDGTVGWIPENNDREYLVNPQHAADSYPVYCPGAPLPRLLIEREGRVIAGQGANNVRAEIGDGADVVGQLPEGSTFIVLDGPRCADGMLWWQVQSGDLMGWTAEGQGDTYWLEVNR